MEQTGPKATLFVLWRGFLLCFGWFSVCFFWVFWLVGCWVFFWLVGFSFVLNEGDAETLESVAHIKSWKINKAASRDRNRAVSQG